MPLIAFFPFFAVLAMGAGFPDRVQNLILYAGYIVAAGVVIRYSWLISRRECEIADLYAAIARTCPPHQAAIIRKLAKDPDDE